MNLPIVVRPEARAEYDEAFDWLDERWPGSGAAFAEAIQKVFDRIAASPKVHGKVRGDVRRATVSGYRYYTVYYREKADSIEVVSVFHTSRDPKIWQERV